MDIRYANKNDAAMLAELGARAFRQAYASQTDPEDLEAYIRGSFSEEIQSAELCDANSLFLILELSSFPAGYARLVMNRALPLLKAARPIELERIYLLQEHIQKGLGSELLRRCIQEARDRRADAIWLGVWEHNQRAIRFYEKWGFRAIGAVEFRLGRKEQRDLIMELPLADPAAGRLVG